MLCKFETLKIVAGGYRIKCVRCGVVRTSPTERYSRACDGEQELVEEQRFDYPCAFRGEAVEIIDGACKGKQTIFRCHSADVAERQNVDEGRAMIWKCVRVLGDPKVQGMAYCEACSLRVAPQKGE